MNKKEDLDTFYRKLKEIVKSEENTTDEEKLELLFYSMLATFVYKETGECDFKVVLDFWDRAHEFSDEEEFIRGLKEVIKAEKKKITGENKEDGETKENPRKNKDFISSIQVKPPKPTQDDTEHPSDAGKPRINEKGGRQPE